MKPFAVKTRSRGCAAGLGLLLALPAAAPAFADTDSGVTSLQGVQVLGSRVRKSDSTTDSPVQIITQEQIAASGLKSIGDILQEMSTSGSSLNTKFNSAGNFGFAPDGSGVGSGSSTLSLRNLNAKRTLVLVDGLRWVNETSASGVSAAVDLNTIPASAIDHIEVLTDGASALYGSDAIAGVVNIVTKKRQNGLALDAYSGWHGIGGGPTSQYDLSYGGKAGGYQYFLDLNHFMQTSISSSDWDQSFYPIPGLGLSEGSSATPDTRTIFANGSNDEGGLCPLSGGVATCDITANGGSKLQQPGHVPNFPNGFHQFSDSDRFNYSPYNLLLTPQRRSSAFFQNSYDFNQDVRWYFRGTYETRDSTNQAAPEPIFLGPDAGTYGRPDTIGVDVSNPYNPFGVTLNANPNNGNLALIGRRPVEGGPRIFEQRVDTEYFATGLEGTLHFGDRYYSWDVNADLGNNRAGQSVQGTYNSLHIEQALGPATLNQTTGQYQCNRKTDQSVIAGCVPLNLFGGPGSITPQMLDWIQYVEHDASHQLLEQVTANISGPIVTLPAGDFSFAAGYEYRRLSGAYSPDSIVINNDSNGVPSLPTAGSYNDNDVYAELDLPILAKLPAARRLDVSLATRHSEYSTFGGTTNSKLGTLWEPTQEFTLKANVAQGFRAPSVGELYGSLNRFDATLVDPCAYGPNNQPPPPTTQAKCTTLGVPGGAYNQANTQISVLTGGDATLRPERSRTSTAGVTYSPSWVKFLAGSRKLDFDLNFYHIRVENAIEAPNAQALLDNCVDTLEPVYCSGISRVKDGNINGFQDQLENLGTIETQGYDFSIAWQGPKSQFGMPGMNWQTTYTEYYRSIATDSGSTEPNVVGVEVADSGIARWHSNLNLSWKTNAVTANWVVRYMSALYEQCGDAAGTPTCSNTIYRLNDQGESVIKSATNKLPSVIYDDVRMEWKLPIKTKVSLAAGITNLFDQGAPICVSCSLNGYDASNYDLPGRYGYVEASAKF